jgi:hypothetical protein
MEPTPSAAPPANTGARVLLGLFILGQLLFLTVNNFQKYFNDERKHPPKEQSPVEPVVPGWAERRGQVDELLQALYEISRYYAQATGQLQNWRLFSPNVCSHVPFAAVELRWDDAPRGEPAAVRPLAVLAAADPLQGAALCAAVTRTAPPRPARLLLSDNEPADLGRYFRVHNYRLRCFESSVCLELSPYDEETERETMERWRKEIHDHLVDYGASVHTYLRRAVREYQRAYPDAPPPRQVILLMRRYRISAPDEEASSYWHGPFVEPVARWRPHVTRPDRYSPVEAYNPVTRQFEDMLK